MKLHWDIWALDLRYFLMLSSIYKIILINY